MSRVFISYRRDDSIDMVGRLYDRLAERLKGVEIFRDVDSIPPGVNFRDHVNHVVGRCDLMIVAIGAKWSGENGGRRRIDEPDDMVRAEVEAALAAGVSVLPIYIRGAPPPTTATLPDTLKGLAHINGLPLRSDPDFRGDSERIERTIRQRTARKRLWWLAAAAVAALMIAAVGALVLLKDPTPTNDTSLPSADGVGEKAVVQPAPQTCDGILFTDYSVNPPVTTCQESAPE